jgi:hypothetical protein
VNTYRLCRVAFVALVLAGCTAPQPVAISSPDTVLADWARRTRPLERLQFEGQVQVEWEDEQGDHMEQGDLAAWLDGDQRSSLRVTKFGDVYLWYGATPDHVWVFDFVSEPSVLRQGPADRDMGAGTLAVRPAVLRMLMGLDPWPADALVTSEQDATVIRGPALGGQFEARLRPDDLQPLTITLTFPRRGRLVAEHRWTTGRVRVDSAPQARRLARVVDLHDAQAKAKVKIRTSHAEALSGEQMDAQATVFDLEKIKAHLRPDVVK